MKSNFWKVLAVAIAASTIVCAGTGCAKNDNKSQESSASSVASSEVSEEESKDDSEQAGKTEESKAEPAEESKADSGEENNEESAEEDTGESAEESAEESVQESDADTDEASEEEDTDDETNNQFVGAWECNVGSKYNGIIIKSDGTAVYKDVNGNSAPARWTVEDGILCIRAAGGLQQLKYSDGNLEEVDTGNIYSPSSTLTED